MGRRAPRIRDIIARRLDSDYAAAVSATLSAIERDNLEASLAALREQARELEERGERFHPLDPSIRALRADFDAALERHTRRIAAIAPDVQEMGVTAAQELSIQKALLGLPSSAQPAVRAAWNQPNPLALAQAVTYTSSPAFQASLARFQSGMADMVQNIALQGLVSGWGPLRTAGEMERVVQGLPVHYANSLMRSLQLTSYRDASVLQQVANADILQSHIRIASLDDRCCAACIALHGTELPLRARVDDHRQGRCDSIMVVRGYPRQIQTGPQWFNSLSSARQARLAPFRSTPAKLEALRAGAVEWPDFVQQGADPVFGEVVSEASLSGILGEAARQYYVRG